MIRCDSVCDCLAIGMKLQGIGIIFLFGVTALAGVANGLCLVRNTTRLDQYYWYQCFRSTDYLADLKKAPVDTMAHTVTNSNIKVIRNGSFARFSKSLVSLGVLYCGVEEIEDKAFHGATNLIALILIGNKLEVIRSAWFEGLPNLRFASFENNRIKTVDENLFSVLPPYLDVLDVANNRLTCLPTASFGNVNVSVFHFEQNRLTWKCRVSLMNWLEENDIREGHLSRTDPPYDLAKICVSRLPTPRLDGEFLDKCVGDTTRGLLPPRGDYTVEQVCEFLKNKHSPFLDCTK